MNNPDLEYAVLAFHGIPNDSLALVQFYAAACELSVEVKQVPAEGGYIADGKATKYLPFEEFSRKIGRIGLEKLSSFSIACADEYNLSNGSSSAAGFSINLENRNTAIFATAKTEVNWLVAASRLLVSAARPSYGYLYFRLARHCPWLWATGLGYDHPDNRGIYERPKERHSLGLWSSPWLRFGVFNRGFMRDVFELNFLSDVVLLKQVEGLALREWIRADGARGYLEPFPGDLWLWRVPKDQLLSIADRLQAAKLLLSDDNEEAMAIGKAAQRECSIRYQAEEAARQAAKKRKASRTKLIELLRLLDERQERSQGAAVAVTLEEFFEGNPFEESIAVNLDEHPGTKKFYSELKKIRAKKTVQDVLVGIVDRPASPEGEDDEFEDDDWPYSDEVYVFTSSPPEDVAKWAAKLEPDQVSYAEWNGRAPINAPELLPGMRLVRLWWD